MYDFSSNYIVKTYGRRQKLLFNDTDSLAYHIKAEDFYQDISSDVEENFAIMQRIIHQELKLDATKN